MKKITFNLVALLLILSAFNNLGYSQSTTVINYQSWTVASGCKIFASSTNVPVAIDGNNETIQDQTKIIQELCNNLINK
ncbi:MAG: hypothetical protein ACRDE2_06140 [Chitinophagaceae bacterium]